MSSIGWSLLPPISRRGAVCPSLEFGCLETVEFITSLHKEGCRKPYRIFEPAFTRDCPLSSQNVPPHEGVPTREELLTHYPAQFTWTELKTFVNSGDLGLLRRDKNLQKRYDAWVIGIQKRYGSMVDYLLKYRLQWGKPDRLSLLPSSLNDQDGFGGDTPLPNTAGSIEKESSCVPLYFKADTPPELVSIIQNDWPYSVPSNIEHTLIWTRLPIFHPSLISDQISARVEQDGLWGFTGNLSPPPSPSALPSCLPALSDWGITMDKLVRSPKGTKEEETMVVYAGKEVHGFVKKRWIEREWETAWFVNPPRLQSVLGLAHIHVFARRKVMRRTNIESLQ